MISINIDEFQNELLKRFDNASRAIDKAVAGVSDIVVNDQKENILTGVSYTGSPLVPNSEFTIKKKGFNWPLVESSDMVKGITKSSIPDGYKIYLGNKASIGAKLQRGYQKVFRGRTIVIPARPFFGISNKLRQKVKAYCKLTFNNIFSGK